MFVSTRYLESGRSVSLRAVVGRESGGHICLQARRTVASGGFPVRTDSLLWSSAAQRLQDRRGGPRAGLRNANGSYNHFLMLKYIS